MPLLLPKNITKQMSLYFKTNLFKDNMQNVFIAFLGLHAQK